MMGAPIGILVMAYGTAAGPDDVERYYTDIRGGRSPSPELLEQLKGRYAAIGNRFPLLEITERQAAGLQGVLDEREPARFRVYLGMKHSPPFIAEGVAGMRADGIERAVGLVLAAVRLASSRWQPDSAASISVTTTAASKQCGTECKRIESSMSCRHSG